MWHPVTYLHVTFGMLLDGIVLYIVLHNGSSSGCCSACLQCVAYSELLLNYFAFFVSYFLHVVSYFLHAVSYFLHVVSYFLHSVSYFLHLVSYLMHIVSFLRQKRWPFLHIVSYCYFLHIISYFLCSVGYCYFLHSMSYFLHIVNYCYFLHIMSYCYLQQIVSYVNSYKLRKKCLCSNLAKTFLYFLLTMIIVWCHVYTQWAQCDFPSSLSTEDGVTIHTRRNNQSETVSV